jgi:hypothetical protein
VLDQLGSDHADIIISAMLHRSSNSFSAIPPTAYRLLRPGLFDSSPHAWSRHWISCSAPRSVIQNPHAKGFSAGGSSSGCAALVCSDQVDLAIGGDQSGSIRIVSSDSVCEVRVEGKVLIEFG